MATVDYGSNIISIMTSNSSSGQIASASSTYGTSWEPWKAFDYSSGTSQGWVSNNTLVGWLKIQLQSGRVVNKYSLKSSSTLTENPKNWTFEASDNGTTWTILDTKTGVTDWIAGAEKEFVINNNVSYTQYRINVTENNGKNYVGIAELQMFEGKMSYVNKVLISSSSGEFRSLIDNGYTSDLTTTMTSADDTIVTASSTTSSSYEWKAFDKSVSTNWSSSVATGWLIYKFSIPKIVAKYTIMSPASNGTTRAPKTWTLSGSNDNGASWSVIDTRLSETGWASSEVRSFNISNVVSYKWYKLDITANNGDTYLQISELCFMEKNNPVLNSIPNNTEQNFINYGMDKLIELDLSTKISTRIFIKQSPTTLGSGKVFKKSIDTSKLPIKNLSIN